MAGAPCAASRFGFRGFISIARTIARGVTAMVVGSGALLGCLVNNYRLLLELLGVSSDVSGLAIRQKKREWPKSIGSLLHHDDGGGRPISVV
jgi:hypothetical protein